jgi:hypothetical protein
MLHRQVDKVVMQSLLVLVVLLEELLMVAQAMQVLFRCHGQQVVAAAEVVPTQQEMAARVAQVALHLAVAVVGQLKMETLAQVAMEETGL